MSKFIEWLASTDYSEALLKDAGPVKHIKELVKIMVDMEAGDDAWLALIQAMREYCPLPKNRVARVALRLPTDDVKLFFAAWAHPEDWDTPMPWKEFDALEESLKATQAVGLPIDQVIDQFDCSICQHYLLKSLIP